MKERIEMHVESCYSWKNKNSVIGVSLLDKLKEENVCSVAIVDYCDCSGIIDFEKKRLELFRPDKFKVIYGVSLNIKYDELYVASIILAKNSKGIKELYRLVSLMNERDCYFVTESDIYDFNNLILGISDIDLEKDYSKVIDKYSYVEVTIYNSKNDVLNIGKFCEKNNLLMIASSRPRRIDKCDKLLSLICSKYVYKKGEEISTSEYYWSTEEMINHFSYLNNVEDVVVNNAYMIVEQISNYKFNYNDRKMIECSNKDAFRDDVFNRLKLIYCEDIPNDVMERLNFEVDVIGKNNLEGTLQVLEQVAREVRKFGYYIDIGGNFSESLIAYVLGISRINPMDLNVQKEIFSSDGNNKFNFEIYIPSEVMGVVDECIKKILGDDKLFRRYRYMELGKHFITSQQKKFEFSDDFAVKFDDIRSGRLPVPVSYFIIPKDVEAVEYSPISNTLSGEKALSFDYRYLENIFAIIRYKTPFLVNRFKILEKKCGELIDDIPLDCCEVFENLFEVVDDNSVDAYDNYVHYNMMNNYDCTLKISLEGKSCPSNIYELLEFGRKESYGWSSKVLRYYYDNYYRVFYPEIYYEVYLRQLVDYFNIKSDNLNDKDNAISKLIIKIIGDMKKLGFQEVIERVMCNEER